MTHPKPEQVDYIVEHFMPRVSDNTRTAASGVISGRFTMLSNARCHGLSHQALRKVVDRIYKIHQHIQEYPH